MVLESDIDDEGTHFSLTLSKVCIFLHCIGVFREFFVCRKAVV